MTSAALRKEIPLAMSAAGVSLSPDILSKCIALASNTNMTATQLVEYWEAHSLNHDVNDLNDTTFSAFRNSVLRHASKSEHEVSDTSVVARKGLGRRSVSSSLVTPIDDNHYDMRTTVDSENEIVKKRKAGLSSVDLILSNSSSITSPQRHSEDSTANTATTVASTASSSSAVVTPSKKSSPSATPAVKSEGQSTIITASMTSFLKYEDRKNQGQIIASYNPHNLSSSHSLGTMSTSTASTTKRRCTISQPDFSILTSPSLVISPAVATAPFRYMFSPNTKRAAALEKKWHSLHRAIRSFLFKKKPTSSDDSLNLEGIENTADEEDVPVGLPQSTPHLCIGRICNEAQTGSLNAASLVLEGSKAWSNGARISLDMSLLGSCNENTGEKENSMVEDGWSFFPGQMVALRGRNGTGRKMVVDQVVAEGAPPTASCKTMVSKLMDFHHSMDYQNGKPLRMFISCGPYTTADNLEYFPFRDLVETIKDDMKKDGNVDVVILMGPFVDLRQPLLKDGDSVVVEIMDDTFDEEMPGLKRQAKKKMHMSYETLFASRIAGELDLLFNDYPDSPTQFVLVPSLDDAICDSIYPQPPLSDLLGPDGWDPKLPGGDGIVFGSLGLKYVEEAGRIVSRKHLSSQKRIHCLPNPCTFQINEVTIGLTSTDALFHLSSEETNANLEPGSRMLRLVRHFIKQRSYYPLFPPSSAPGSEVSLDLTKLDKLDMPCQPDLLILPSKLMPFSKCVLHKTVVINPGHLVKETAGGTYAEVTVHPIKRETLEAVLDTGDIELDHGIQDRVRVDIKRI